MLLGPNMDAIRSVSELSLVPVIASGGVRTVDDLEDVRRLSRLRIVGIIIGRAIYERQLDLARRFRLVEAGPVA